MITALPPEHVLLAFFGSEPELLDPRVPWFYNQLTFIVDRKGERVTCTIQPAYGQITVQWERHGDQVAGISVTKLRTLDVISEEGASCLVATAKPTLFKCAFGSTLTSGSTPAPTEAPSGDIHGCSPATASWRLAPDASGLSWRVSLSR